ncbi:MAG: hypothetical protein AAF757_02705 [Cyanobacteria bacterium P01_D01_bin.116]
MKTAISQEVELRNEKIECLLYTKRLNDKERGFLSDKINAQKWSPRQNSWFLDILKKYNIPYQGDKEILIGKPKREPGITYEPYPAIPGCYIEIINPDNCWWND